MPSKRELHNRLGAVENDFPSATSTTIEMTPAVRRATLEVIRYRQRNAYDEELTPSMVHEAIEHMDDDLAAAIREADLG